MSSVLQKMSFLSASSLEDGPPFVQKLGKKRLREKVTTFITGWLRALEKQSEWGFFKYCLCMDYMINLKWFIVTSLPLSKYTDKIIRADPPPIY